MKTAILIDGGFFLKRYKNIKGFEMNDDPEVIAKNLIQYCYKHIEYENTYRKKFQLPSTELHRIYFYDAKPFSGDSQNPVSKKQVSFKRTAIYRARNELFEVLRKQRKIALRLGFLKNSSKSWTIRASQTKPLLGGKIQISDLTEDDVVYPLTQKAVDMKLGLDIATLAFKQQVDQIILIAGDSDFVPASKFARREGIDFILDPMLNKLDPTLHEHIDGLRTIKDMSK